MVEILQESLIDQKRPGIVVYKRNKMTATQSIGDTRGPTSDPECSYDENSGNSETSSPKELSSEKLHGASFS